MKQNKEQDSIKAKIRKDNLHILIGLHEGTVSSVAKATRISRTTLSRVMHGTAMLSKHARAIEEALEKPFGWMDKIHEEEELSPFYEKQVLRAAVACLYSAAKITNLYDALNTDGKVDFLDKLYNLFTDPAARALSPRTILTMLGVKNETKANLQREISGTQTDNQ